VCILWLHNASYISLLQKAPAIPQLCSVTKKSILLPCCSGPMAFSCSGEYFDSYSLLYIKNAVKSGKYNLNRRPKGPPFWGCFVFFSPKLVKLPLSYCNSLQIQRHFFFSWNLSKVKSNCLHFIFLVVALALALEDFSCSSAGSIFSCTSYKICYLIFGTKSLTVGLLSFYW